MKTCTYEDCSKQQPKLTRGWCSNHYQRWRRYGSPAFLKNDVCEPKICDYCGSSFMPKRLATATTCSGACNLKRWRRNNVEHNQKIKMNWRRKNGVLEQGSLEHRKRQAEKSRGNKNRWVEDRSKLSRVRDRRSSASNAWRREILIRDNFRCQIANKHCGGGLEAHHILRWRDYPELRFELNNGITLCHSHHLRKRIEETESVAYFQQIIGAFNGRR